MSVTGDKDTLVVVATGSETQPGRRESAPGELKIVQDFLNTADLEAGSDELADPDALREWLGRRGLLDPRTPLSEGDLRRALAVREALRGLALANHDGDPDPRDLEVLNRVAGAARLRFRFERTGGARLEPDLPGIDGALACLLAIVVTAFVEGTWGRVKVCRSETCRWAFYDRSRNRSSRWCTMALCGNRRKARAYRRRRRGPRPSRGPREGRTG